MGRYDNMDTRLDDYYNMSIEFDYGSTVNWEDMIDNLLDNTNIPRTSHQTPPTQENTRRPQTPQENYERP